MQRETLAKIISVNIKKYRRKKGLTQFDMTQFGFGRRQWQYVENGKNITLSTLLKIANALSISPDRLLKK